MSERMILLDQELPFKGDRWERLVNCIGTDQIQVVDPKDRPKMVEALAKAEIAIMSGDIDAAFLDAPALRWVHCDHAGLTRSAVPEVFAKGLIVTGSAGRSAPALAEHAMMFALLLCSRYSDFYEAQKRQEWLRTPEMADLRALSGRTMGILGMGHTGQALATRAKAFDMRVLGYRRRHTELPAGVDRMYSADLGESIDEILEQSDVLALVLNLSDATYRMIGEQQIARMKPSAVIVNMGRGGLIDTDAMMAALDNGRIAGAGLDVTDPEPLPAGHPLWTTRNCLITPHFTASLPDRQDRSLDVICDNLNRFRSGQKLRNQITIEDIWSHG